MLFAVSIGVLSAMVILICMCRMDIRKFMGYPAIMDIAITMILIVMLHGSYVGMVAAVIGGLVFSGMITVIRRYYGYKKLTLKGWVTHNGSMVTAYNQAHSTLTKKENLSCIKSNWLKPLPVCIAVSCFLFLIL